MEHRDPAGAIRLCLVAGPDAGRTIVVRDRPLTIGRADGPGHVADPALEAHHLLFDPLRRTVLQLTGRIPARIDGTPIGRRRTVRRGAVVELGASRITVDGRPPPPPSPTALVLGVGEPLGRGRPAAPVTVDASVVRRVLVAGPSATALAAALAARAARREPVSLTADSCALRTRPVGGCFVIAHVPDPDAEWPAHELPSDAVVVSVGASWRASIVGRAPSGGLVLQRFHAAGDGSRPNRAVVAQQVSGAGPELGRDVARVPQPARRE